MNHVVLCSIWKKFMPLYYWSHIGSTLATHSREALEEVEMGSRAEMMGDPMARADKLRLQKQVLEIQNMPLV